MSSLVDNKPWTEDEKIVLLTEIIRASKSPRVNSKFLADLIRLNQIEPKWGDMPLPQGRTLNQCTRAFHELTSPAPPQAPRSIGYPSIEPRPPPLPPSRKRPLTSGERSTPTDRAILPRPAVLRQSNGENLVFNQLSASEILEPQRKKRGRPSNKDLEERRAAAAARGEPFLSPRPSSSRKPKRSSISQSHGPSLRPFEPARGPVASPDPLQTPLPPATEKSGDSSSGKKRKRGAKSASPTSPVSATKKKSSPRETKNRSLDQSPTASAGRGVSSTQQTIAEPYIPRGSISRLLTSSGEQESLQKPADVQMGATQLMESLPTTRASPRRTYEPAKSE